MKSKMKKMDMIKAGIKTKKTIGLNIEILKKILKIKMKNNMMEKVKEIIITEMKKLHKINSKIIEEEISKIEMIIIENFKIEVEDRAEEKEEDTIKVKEEGMEEEKGEEKEEEDIDKRMKQATTHKCIKVIGNKIKIQEKTDKVLEEEVSLSIRKKEKETQTLK